MIIIIYNHTKNWLNDIETREKNLNFWESRKFLDLGETGRKLFHI